MRESRGMGIINPKKIPGHRKHKVDEKPADKKFPPVFDGSNRETVNPNAAPHRHFTRTR